MIPFTKYTDNGLTDDEIYMRKRQVGSHHLLHVSTNEIWMSTHWSSNSWLEQAGNGITAKIQGPRLKPIYALPPSG